MQARICRAKHHWHHRHRLTAQRHLELRLEGAKCLSGSDLSCENLLNLAVGLSWRLLTSESANAMSMGGLRMQSVVNAVGYGEQKRAVTRPLHTLEHLLCIQLWEPSILLCWLGLGQLIHCLSNLVMASVSKGSDVVMVIKLWRFG